LYQFVNRDPVNFLDPLGEWFIVNLVRPCTEVEKGEVCVTATLYDNNGVPVGQPIMGLAQGQSGRSNDEKYRLKRLVPLSGGGFREEIISPKDPVLGKYGQAERRALINGDTPFGVYLTGRVGLPTIQRKNLAEPYGRVKINFGPIGLEAGVPASRVDESKKDIEIRMHGGPLLHGALKPTLGCMRFHDNSLQCFARQIEELEDQAPSGEEGVILVGNVDFFRALIKGEKVLEEPWPPHAAHSLDELWGRTFLLRRGDGGKWSTESIEANTGVPLWVVKETLRRVVSGGW
jgi:hypothetical protein